jgi:hypothetical protein
MNDVTGRLAALQGGVQVGRFRTSLGENRSRTLAEPINP